MLGSKCSVYLLEKSRVVGSSLGERGYHVFYQLLEGSEDCKSWVWEGLKGMTGKDFKYIGEDGVGAMIEGERDGVKFERTKKAMSTLGIEEGERERRQRA